MPIKRYTRQPWFGWFDLACVTASCLIWYLRGRSGWWFLLIALLPWCIRLLSGAFPFKRTPFDLALAIFLLTAGVGVWASYDRPAAWSKFWIIVLAIVLYYSLAAQPRQNLWPLVAILCFLGATLAALFLLSYDWQDKAADLALLTRMGKWWRMIRPEFPAIPLGPNKVGGILAMLFPFAVILILRNWMDWKHRGRSIVPVFYAVLTGALVVLGLFWTSSRGAWVALGLSLFVWMIWFLAQRPRRRLQPKQSVILLMILFFAVSPLLWALVSGEGIARLIDLISGSPNGLSRLEIYTNSLRLISDFPFTGGGLAAFPGLYSQYMLVIPYLFINYSHNFLIEVAIDQGLFGLVAVVWIFLGSFLILGRQIHAERDEYTISLIGQAVLVGVLVVAMHGLLDDALYGYQGTMILFLLPGMATALSLSPGNKSRDKSFLNSIDKKWKVLSAGVVFLVLVTAVVFSNKLLGIWWANLGAVHMARTQLIDFPSEEWEDSSDLAAVSSVGDCFTQAIKYDPFNVTANYRLGLLAMLRHDYPTAVAYLESAYVGDQRHRGIIKNLGYSDVWLGQYANAQSLLNHIPESAQELNVYTWWWEINGRSDLSQRAQQMLTLLQQTNPDY